jgi:cob(I)alamin adenosyltransferase
MKIYTKKGDSGSTSLYDGTKVIKNDIIVESVGSLDELNSELGLILAYYDITKNVGRMTTNNPHHEKNKKYYELLNNIQSELFDLGSIIAKNPNNSKEDEILFDKNNEYIKKIEEYIDEMTNILPPLRNFILPGGNVLIATIHKARTVCRRTERNITSIKYAPRYFNEDTLEISLENVNRCLAYINRMSDYLFTLARFTTYIQDVEEVKYIRSEILSKNN